MAGINIPAKITITNVESELKALFNELQNFSDNVKGLTYGDDGAINRIANSVANAAVRRAKEEIKAAGDKAVEDLKKSDEYKKASDTEKKDMEDNARQEGERSEASRIFDSAKSDVKKTLEDSLDVEMLKIMKGVSEDIKGLGESLISFSKQIWGVVEDVYKEMKKSSPLLQAMEQLFNLAWQLFFMPLGNKLGELLIPAMINMLDTVMDIWDKFEGKTLGEMISIGVTEGVKLIVQFLKDVGNELKDQGGVIGAIGEFLLSISKFLDTRGVELAQIALDIFTYLVSNLGNIIVTAFELILVSISIMIGLMTSSFTAILIGLAGVISVLGAIGLTISVIALGVAAVALAALSTVPAVVGSTAATTTFLTGNAVAEHIGLFELADGNAIVDTDDTLRDALRRLSEFAEGGHIDATPGGRIVRVAEAGEGEWVIPDSKLQSVLSGDVGVIPVGNTYNEYNTSTSASRSSAPMIFNITVNGYTDTDLASKIKNEVSDMITQGRYRSGF